MTSWEIEIVTTESPVGGWKWTAYVNGRKVRKGQKRKATELLALIAAEHSVGDWLRMHWITESNAHEFEESEITGVGYENPRGYLQRNPNAEFALKFTNAPPVNLTSDKTWGGGVDGRPL